MRGFFGMLTKLFSTIYPVIDFKYLYTDADKNKSIKDFAKNGSQLKSVHTRQTKYFRTWNCLPKMEQAKNGGSDVLRKTTWKRKFPHAVSRCVLFKGTNKALFIDDKSFEVHLPTVFATVSWLESKLQVAL